MYMCPLWLIGCDYVRKLVFICAWHMAVVIYHTQRIKLIFLLVRDLSPFFPPSLSLSPPPSLSLSLSLSPSLPSSPSSGMGRMQPLLPQLLHDFVDQTKQPLSPLPTRMGGAKNWQLKRRNQPCAQQTSIIIIIF